MSTVDFMGQLLSIELDKGSQQKVRCSILVIGDSVSGLTHLSSLLKKSPVVQFFKKERVQGQHLNRSSSPQLVVVDLNVLTDTTKKKLQLLKAKYKAPMLGIVAPPDDHSAAILAELELDYLIFKPLRPMDLDSNLRIVKRLLEAQCHSFPAVDRRNRLRRKVDLQTGQVEGPAVEASFQLSEQEKRVVSKGRSVKLSPMEFELFRLLTSEIGRVFSPEEIIARLWPDNRLATGYDVKQHIYLLRRKIEKDTRHPRWIKTVRGCGYMFDADTVRKDDS
jgi:two-component system alkaline phosphatase synthesis response regulator PhoP